MVNNTNNSSNSNNSNDSNDSNKSSASDSNARFEHGQFSEFHVCVCGLDPGNLKIETVRTHKQHICFYDLRRSICMIVYHIIIIVYCNIIIVYCIILYYWICLMLSYIILDYYYPNVILL